MGEPNDEFQPNVNEAQPTNKASTNNTSAIERDIERIDKWVDRLDKDIQRREDFIDRLRIWVLVIVGVASIVGTWAGITLSTVRADLTRTTTEVKALSGSVGSLTSVVQNLSGQLDVAKASLAEVLTQRDELISQMARSAEAAKNSSLHELNQRQVEIQGDMASALAGATAELDATAEKNMQSLNERFTELIDNEIGVTVLAYTDDPNSFVRSKPDDVIKNTDVVTTRVDTFNLSRPGVLFVSLVASADYNVSDLRVRRRVGLTSFINIGNRQCGADSSIYSGNSDVWQNRLRLLTSASCVGIPLNGGEHRLSLGAVLLSPAQGTETYPWPIEWGYDINWTVVADTTQR